MEELGLGSIVASRKGINRWWLRSWSVAMFSSWNDAGNPLSHFSKHSSNALRKEAIHLNWSSVSGVSPFFQCSLIAGGAVLRKFSSIRVCMGNFLFPSKFEAQLSDFKEENSGRLWQVSYLLTSVPAVMGKCRVSRASIWKQVEMRKKACVVSEWASKNEWQGVLVQPVTFRITARQEHTALSPGLRYFMASLPPAPSSTAFYTMVDRWS